MRLTKLKIAGFKSFVDPTTVTFPSSLTGVVGPNGCGKSNIIDAVRWVMGEISAKHLRGESMADVIFNGSAARKPLGAASVELVFDNSDGKIGGEYAAYNEVALRRAVSRDRTTLSSAQRRGAQTAGRIVGAAHAELGHRGGSARRRDDELRDRDAVSACRSAGSRSGYRAYTGRSAVESGRPRGNTDPLLRSGRRSDPR